MPTKATPTIVGDIEDTPEEPEEIDLPDPPEENPATIQEDEPDAPDDEEELLDLDTADPEMELWPGGPKAGQVREWRERYKKIYVTTIDPYNNEHYMWRPLNRTEYRALHKAMEDALLNGQSQGDASNDNEEMTMEIVLLWPQMTREQIRASDAGLPTTIAQDVAERSGFVAVELRQL